MTWHLLMIVIVGGCSYAAWWQWGRAAQGNTLSYLYSIEWPVFAVVAIIGWWQLVTEKPEDFEARKEIRRQASLPKPVAYDTEVLRRELARHPELVHSFPELATAFPELASGGAAPLGPGGGDHLPGGTAPGGDHQADLEPTGPAGTVDLWGGGEVVAAPSSEVAAYNEVLAQLAAKGKAKTWRNPRGRST
jgi:hypothetical protein